MIRAISLIDRLRRFGVILYRRISGNYYTMAKIPQIPNIPEEQRTPLVAQLLEVIRYQMEIIQCLRDEIAILKGDKPKPKIEPGKMGNGLNDNRDKKSSEGKRAGYIKKSKTDY